MSEGHIESHVKRLVSVLWRSHELISDGEMKGCRERRLQEEKRVLMKGCSEVKSARI